MVSMSILIVFFGAFLSFVSALPRILNTNLDSITQGKPFTLQISGCDEGCNLTLAAFNGTGENKSIQDYGSWEIPTNSNEYTLTLNHLGDGDYWFYLKIGSHENRYAGVTQSDTFHLGKSNDDSNNSALPETTSSSAVTLQPNFDQKRLTNDGQEPVASTVLSSQVTTSPQSTAKATSAASEPVSSSVPSSISSGSGRLNGAPFAGSLLGFTCFIMLL